MSLTPITQLTPEQEALIPQYQQKWQQFALSTEPIDRPQVIEAIHQAYSLLDRQVPEIIFVDSLDAAFNFLTQHKDLLAQLNNTLKEEALIDLKTQNRNDLIYRKDLTSKSVFQSLTAELMDSLINQIDKNTEDSLRKEIHRGFINLRTFWTITRQVKKVPEGIDKKAHHVIFREFLFYNYAADCAMWDFCISELQCTCDRSVWEAIKSLTQSCSSILAFDRICIVSDRPRQFYLDKCGRFHAVGQPAIEFADGYKLYYYHGKELPEKYGKYFPQEWQIEWFVAEKDCNIQAALAEGMGLFLESLTPAQINLIPVYRQKWRSLFLQTQPIDRDKAAAAIDSLYQFRGMAAPRIIFCSSPYAMFKTAANSLTPNWELSEYLDVLSEQLSLTIDIQMENIDRELRSRSQQDNLSEEELAILEIRDRRLGVLSNQIFASMNLSISDIDWQEWNIWYFQGRQDINEEREHGYLDIWRLDFCISTLNCYCDRQAWEVYHNVMENCGLFLTFEDICLVCERPQQLRVNENFQLHAEGEPAIVYGDGFKAYAYRGITLPEKYGSIHPQQWQSEWLLTEENAELRRALIQGIGYARICQELNAETLDAWREYELLKIENDIDEEPIYLLKMTCPSTGFIHALRVPPDIDSARSAIRWVNWGIDPDEFAAQT